MTIVVRAGTFIDGNGGEPKRGVNLHLEGNAIVKIGGEIPRDATVIDRSEQTVMPGMIDCHVHLWSTPASIEERLDLIAVAGDPLADIAVLQKVEAITLVMRDGHTDKQLED